MRDLPHFFTGSLPYLDAETAIGFVRTRSSHLPFLPQLPERSAEEDMLAQVISRLDSGYWSDESSCCLKPFVSEFGNFEQVKVQLVGPHAIARAMSSDYETVWPLWFQFVQGIVAQMDGLGLMAKLWIQIDEPFWKEGVELHPEYASLVCSLRGMRAGTRVGIQASHADRPRVPLRLGQFSDFLGFNFLEKPLDEKDAGVWQDLLRSSRCHLIAGLLGPESGGDLAGLKPYGFLKDRLWVSAPGGLSEWSEAQIEARFPAGAALPVSGDIARVTADHGKEG